MLRFQISPGLSALKLLDAFLELKYRFQISHGY